MLHASQEVCVDVAGLCAHKSTSIMIGMLEDEVALETQKYKMPYIHSQMEKRHALQLFILCAHACSTLYHFCPIIFYAPFHIASAPSYLMLLYLSATG